MRGALTTSSFPRWLGGAVRARVVDAVLGHATDRAPGLFDYLKEVLLGRRLDGDEEDPAASVADVRPGDAVHAAAAPAEVLDRAVERLCHYSHAASRSRARPQATHAATCIVPTARSPSPRCS